jgi:predicted AlkP superfamily phosphohydrolase/phosphomutase
MKKVLMIGLDGATFSLLNPLMDEGVMPFLKELMGRGVHADLMSTQNPLTPPAWVSMVTGRSPDVHGIFDFLRPQPEGDMVFLKVNDSRYIRCETLWSMASRQGRRVTSLNFFGMAPPFPVDGYMIAGFVPWKYLRSATHPPSFYDRLKTIPDLEYRHLGMAISEEKKCIQGLEDAEFEEWIRLQGDRDGAWVGLLAHLMRTDPTELTAMVLDGPDKIQHLFWRFLDRELYDRNPTQWDTHIRELCLDYYRALDGRIKRLVELAGPETNIVMTSDHGFGATTEVVYVNEWLAANGYLAWTGHAAADGSRKLTLDKIKDHTTNIDWPNTKAYSVTPSSNAIYLKRDTGDGRGVKDSEYPDFCRALRERLLAWRDPANGEQVFVEAYLNEKKMAGAKDAIDYGPDITLRLRDGGFVSIVRSGGDIIRPREKADGTHRPNGIFIAQGPDIEGEGERLAALDILDITPLLLHLAGLPVPTDLEGRVPTEIFTSESLSRNPVKVSGATQRLEEDGGEPKKDVSDEEKEALIAQMKVLGYMD